MTWRLIRGLRHPVRGLAAMLAALCVVGGVASGPGVAGALAGAAVGVLLGELLGRSRLRVWTVLLVALLPLLGCWAVAGGLTWLSTPAELLGTRTVLLLRGLLLPLGVALFLVASLRALARRRPWGGVVEASVFVAALAFALAPHREGMLTRPNWLADPAWRAGLDPAALLLVLGGGMVSLLALARLGEPGGRTSPFTPLAVPLVALVLVLFLMLVRPGVEPPEDPLLAFDEDLAEAILEAEAGEAPQGSGEEDEQAHGEGVGRGASGGQGGGDGGEGSETSTLDDLWEDAEPPSGEQPAPQPVAVVLLGDDYEPPFEVFYLRQDTWSVLEGGRLVPPRHGEVDGDVARAFPVDPITLPPPPGELRRQVHHRVAAISAPRLPFAIESPVSYAPLHNPDPLRFDRAWQAVSLAWSGDFADLVGRPLHDPDWPDQVRSVYLEAPADPRYARLAREIVEERHAEDPLAKAVAVKLWLDRETRYTRSRSAGGADPAGDFLFGDRTGYCVHTAHAAVYLWRALGIPARISVGYAVMAEQRRGSAFLVMDQDAHSWPEIYVEGAGWIPLDITPHQMLDEMAPPPDEDLVRLLADLARTPPDTQAMPDMGVVGGVVARLAVVLLFLATLAVLGLHYLAKAWRRLRPGLAGRRALARVGYRLALDRLAEIGLSRRYGETRERFARRVLKTAPSFERLTALHLAVRLGDPGMPLPDEAAWREALRELARELSQAVPAWRRLVGLIDPTSIHRAR